ncbi:hypothetical protein HWV62_36687 [Athelia sp. TMB]|nr:hypothetical protein HWV62_36687 [Athelia sp. TMB]
MHLAVSQSEMVTSPDASDGRYGTISPISNVSPELLSALFREAFHYNSTRTSNTLSHVSRTWRQVAIDDPMLWNTINLTPRGESKFAELCLQRSKQSDLTIRYADETEYELHDEPVLPFDPAVLRLPRARKLQLFFGDRKGAFVALRALKHTSPPRLACFELTLEGNSEHWVNEDRPGDIFTGGAPLLASIMLDCVSALECHVPLSNVTELCLVANGPHSEQYPDLDATEFIGILLEVAPTLKRLELRGSQVFSAADDDSSWVDFELPALVTLAIGHIDEESREECEAYHGNFWKFARMPVLEELSLNSLTSEQTAEACASLKGYSGLGVKSLSLSSVETEMIEDEIAGIFPNLCSLTLDEWTSSYLLPNLIAADRDRTSSAEPIAWPLLQSLTFEDCCDGSKHVRRYIIQREGIGCPIKKITFLGRRLAHAALRCARKHVGVVTLGEGLGAIAAECSDGEDSESESEDDTEGSIDGGEDE